MTAAIGYLHEGDMLTVQEVDRLGRNLLEGLIMLNELLQRGVAGKVLDGIAAGEHTERSLVLDLALALGIHLVPQPEPVRVRSVTRGGHRASATAALLSTAGLARRLRPSSRYLQAGTC